MSVAKLSLKRKQETGLVAGFELQHPQVLFMGLIKVQLTSALQSV